MSQTEVLILVLIVILAIIAFVVFLDKQCEGAQPAMWKVLLAEGASEGEVGMKAICCVLRNREAKGLPMGCVGAQRPDLDAFCYRQGPHYEKLAKRLVRAVFVENCPDITNGATHFESTSFPVPAWAEKMEIVFKHKRHIFYREK